MGKHLFECNPDPDNTFDSSRRKSAGSRNGFIYNKQSLAVMQESPYEIKSVKSEHSHRSGQEKVPSHKSNVSSRPVSPESVTSRKSVKSTGSVSDVDTNNGRNPFESNDEED